VDAVTASTASALACFAASLIAPGAVLVALAPAEAAAALDRARGAVLRLGAARPGGRMTGVMPA
jgi:hypothetical protein